MKSKKTVFSTLVVLAIVLSAFALPMQALADTGCTSGTRDNDTIVCDVDTEDDVNGKGGDDEITVTTDGQVTGSVNGGKGKDTITNNGTVTENITGGSQSDEITNSGTAGSISGDGGSDTITNNGTVKKKIAGGSGGDEIINSGTAGSINGDDGSDIITNIGTVTNDVKANSGNDMVILETGVQVGGTIFGADSKKAAAIETDTLVFNMSTYNQAEYYAAQTVIAGATDETQAYKFAWDGGAIKWQYFDTLVDKLTLLFKSELQPQPEPETENETEPESAATATLIFVEEGVLKVYQNNASGTLRFYGLGENSQTFIAELSAQSWANALPGDVLLDYESIELETRLVVTALENGQLQVEYYSLADGTLLFSKTITP